MTWQRSSRCEANACLEVHHVGDLVSVRNSAWPDRVLVFTVAEWRAFLQGARDGEFDVEASGLT